MHGLDMCTVIVCYVLHTQSLSYRSLASMSRTQHAQYHTFTQAVFSPQSI